VLALIPPWLEAVASSCTRRWQRADSRIERADVVRAALVRGLRSLNEELDDAGE